MREEKVKTDQGIMSRAEARIKAESELETALVALMEQQDYAGAILYAQLAKETIEAIETDIVDEAEEIADFVEALAKKEATNGSLE